MTSITTWFFSGFSIPSGGFRAKFAHFALVALLLAPVQAYTSDASIGPGDIIKLQVFGEEDLTGSFTIRKDGTIKINWVEPISILGLTPEEAQEAIRDYLDEKYIIDPKVNLIVEEFRSRTVSVMGEVNRPGLVPLKKDSTILSVLLEVGGPTKAAGDELMILRHEGKEKKEYNSVRTSLKKLLSGSDLLQNRKLEPGDILYVASLSDSRSSDGGDTVYVLGAVKKGGSFRFRAGLTALDAFIEAGRGTKFASPNGTKIYRGKGKERKVIPVKLGDVIKKGHRRKNVELQAGDLMIIPEGIL